jgi:dTDP-4-dehydrorhamnose reductase
VDGAEQEEALATAVNGNGVGFLAQEAAKAGARLVHFSTDYVFAGEKETGYTENDAPAPLNAYGRSKLAGEQALQRTTKDLLLIRSAWLYGPSGKNFVDTMRQKMKAGEPLRVVNDQEGSPTFTEDLVEATLALLMRNAPSGIYHLVNSGRTTWFGLAEEIQKTLGTTSELIPVPSAEFPRPASRPRYSVLQNAKTDPLPAWEDALTRYLHATS